MLAICLCPLSRVKNLPFPCLTSIIKRARARLSSYAFTIWHKVSAFNILYKLCYYVQSLSFKRKVWHDGQDDKRIKSKDRKVLKLLFIIQILSKSKLSKTPSPVSSIVAESDCIMCSTNIHVESSIKYLISI